jgi:hypothetical protein
LSPPYSVALTPHSPVKESSSENAAMVLKNAKASQEIVCPVDILKKQTLSFEKPMPCDMAPGTVAASAFPRIWSIY